MANSIGERNLIFGILAVQKKLISAEAFAAAMKVWVQDKTKGLAQILRDQKALTENHHAVAEELVYQHLKGHGNDAVKGLAALSLVGAARQGVAAITDAEVQAGLAKVPAVAPTPPAPKPVAPPKVVAPSPPSQMAEPTKPPTPAPAKHSGVPGWVLLAGGAVVGLGAIALGLLVVVGVVVWMVIPRPADPIAKRPDDPIVVKPPPKDPKDDPIVVKPKDPKDDPIVVKPPPKDPKDDPIIVKPPPKDPKDDPIVVKPAGKDAEFILELPRPAARALLTADGRYVAFTTSNIGSFGYREAPAFDQNKAAFIDNTLTAVQPLASTLDGKKIAFTADTFEGPKVLIWDWTIMKVESTIPFAKQATACAFSPDGSYLLTHQIKTSKTMPDQHWLHLHEVRTGKMPSQWKLEAEPAIFGFTPDSRTVFFAAKEEQTARTWSLITAQPGVIAFPQLDKRYAFARDFTKLAYIDTPNQLQMAHVDGVRPIGKIDTKKENLHVKAAAFSPDNRLILVATEDFAKRPNLTSKCMLIDLVNGKQLSLTEKLEGIPDKIEMGANGVALIQGVSLRPRLYRFPTGDVFVKAPVGPTPGFVSLFNGKDLTGWKAARFAPNNWRVEGGVLIGSNRGKVSGRLYTEKPQPKDFHLRVEARLPENGTGSLGFRCPDESVVGYEAMMSGGFKDVRVGGLNSIVPGRNLPMPRVAEEQIPFGQWFLLEVIAEGPHLIVKVDGKVTTDVLDANTLASGHLVLTQYGAATVEFRRIEIKELNFVAAPPPPPPVIIPAEGFVPLFNHKDLTGWAPDVRFPGIWRVENGILVGSAPVPGNLLTTRSDFKDFHLRVETRFNDQGVGRDGGLLFRATADLLGFDTLINHPAKTTGNTYVRARTEMRDTGISSIRVLPGQWCMLEIFAVGDRVTVVVDGKTVGTFLDKNKEFTSGRIGLHHTAKTKLEFRRIEIKELNLVVAPPPVVPVDGWVQLFNNKDLTGWKFGQFPLGDFRVVDGVLVGNAAGGKHGMIYTERPQAKDFHLRIEAKIGDQSSGYVRFRCPEGKILGYAAPINSTIPPVPMTGSLDAIIPGKGIPLTRYVLKPEVPAEQWFLFEVIADGERLTVKVNGKTMANEKDLNYLGAGHIGLSSANGVISFKKVEIKELNLVAAPPPPIVPAEGFVALFNGKDLSGWLKHPVFPGDWRVDKGILNGSGPRTAYLHTTRGDYRDTHLRVEARFRDGGIAGPGGVLCRTPRGLHGYEGMFHFAKNTGSAYLKSKTELRNVKGQPLPIAPDEWFLMEMIVEGNRVRVKVNGVETASFLDDKNEFTSGHIALHQSINGTLEFRRIEIKELNPVAAPAPGALPFPVEDGFVSLFNGRDLAGWKQGAERQRDWQVINGNLTGVGGNLNMLYTPRDDFGDFHLRAEVKINDDGFGSLGFRFPYGPDELHKSRIGGYAVRLNGKANDLSKSGSLMVYEKIGMRHIVVKDPPLMRPGEWFNLEIIAKGDFVVTKVNGQEAISFLNPKTDLHGGRLYLEANSTNRNTIVEYRKIEIKEFKQVRAPAPPPPEGPLGDFLPVFNGKDLTGWRVEGNDGWKVEAGELVGTGPDTALISKRTDYRSFIARVELSATGDTDAFFSFRQIPDPDGKVKVKGLTSRLIGDGVTIRAGYMGRDAAKFESGNQQIQLRAGEWVSMEYRVRQDGSHIFANGKQTSGILYGPDIHPPGAIGLHIAKGTVRIKKFEISAEPPFGGPVVAPVPPVVPPFVPVGDFVPLFNGKDLVGWQPHLKTAGNWRVANTILTGTGEDAGVLHTVRPDFKDFHLRMDARFTVPPDADSSGILFRSAFGNSGYETVFANGKLAGGLFLNGKDFGKAIPAATPANVPAGEWCTIEVFAEGQRIQIKVNGKDTTEFLDQDKTFTTGHIALRQGADCKLEFKKIEIRELKPGLVVAPPPPPPDPPKGGAFRPLFNGKDLDGWQPHAKRPGNWKVENNILIGSAPIGGSLYTNRADFRDFRLRAEVKINDKGFGRIFTRAAYDPTKVPFKVYGYETLINLRPLGDKIGTLTATSQFSSTATEAREIVLPPGEWIVVEIIAKGEQVTVKVNGATVADYRDDRNQFARVGHIALHQDAGALIEFRKVEIDDFTAPKVGLVPPPPIEPAKGGKGFAVSMPAKNPGKWRVEGNELVQDSVKGPMSIFFGDPKWTDYDFSVDFMRTAGTSQVGLWFRRQQTVDDGYFLLFAASKGAVHLAGRMKNYNLEDRAPLPDFEPKLIEDNRWYTARISVRGDKAECFLDGVKHFDLATEKLPAGMVGLRTWFTAYRFKNIKVTAPDGAILLDGLPDLTPAPMPVPPPIVVPKDGAFVPLFNGKDLVGWKTFAAQKTNWRVEDGILIAAGPVSSRVHTPRDDFKNFHLRVEARISDQSAAGVFVRAPFSSFQGYEAKINSTHLAPQKTGSLLAHVPNKPINLVSVTDPPVPFGEWFTLEVIAQGKRITVLVNGKTTADSMDIDDAYLSGHIAFRQEARSMVELRKIEIKELPTP